MAADPLPDREDWHEPMLKALAEIGLELARGLLRREAAKAVDDETGRDPQLAFARVSRAVRQSVALSAHLRQQRQAVAAKAAEAAAHEVSGDEAQMDRARHERVVARVRALCRRSEVVGRLTAAIEAEAAEGEVERLLGDLDQRLDVAANDIDFAARPIDEVIAGIRHDLGLEPRAVASRAALEDDEGFDDEWGDDDDEPGGGVGRGEPGGALAFSQTENERADRAAVGRSRGYGASDSS